MSTLDLCEKLFETRDIYKLLEVEKDAEPKEIKKAYYKLSLQVHPDRVVEKEKKVATEKFKILSKIYQVLTDKDKRALYDEQGIIDDDEGDLEGKLNSWLDLWRKIFKPLTEEDIDNYHKSYVGSELERNDIKKAYLSGKGCINSMMSEVPFMKVEDEPRIKEIVLELIAANEVPEYKIFTEEPIQKRNRRHKKYARESKEAEKIKENLKAAKESKSNDLGNLEQQIMSRKQARESNYNSLMDRLMQKYAEEDDESDIVDFDKLDKKTKKKKPKQKQETSRKQNVTAATLKLNGVKSGRVKKQRK